MNIRICISRHELLDSGIRSEYSNKVRHNKKDRPTAFSATKFSVQN